MQSPSFSIIIPIYNVAPYLDECLTSLYAQTESSWEAHGIDDGSTDDSGEYLTQWLRKDVRFKATFQRNGGLSAARNRALTSVSGQYIGFLDSDDAVVDWWLAEALKRFIQTNADLVRFDLQLWRGTRPKGVFTSSYDVLKEASGLQAWGWKIFSTAAFACAYFLTREIASHVRFPVLQRIKEDCIFGFRLLPYLRKVCVCKAKPYLYRMRATSLLHASCSVDVPLGLLAQARSLMTLRTNVRDVQVASLSIFACKAVTDWVTRIDPHERSRYREVQTAFNTLLQEKVFTYSQLIPLHWQVSFWFFRHFGWVVPIRMHSFLYRAYLKLLIRRV